MGSVETSQNLDLLREHRVEIPQKCCCYCLWRQPGTLIIILPHLGCCWEATVKQDTSSWHMSIDCLCCLLCL